MATAPNFDKFEPLITRVRKLFEVALGDIQDSLKNQKLSEWSAARKKQIEQQISASLRVLNAGSIDLAQTLTSAAYADGLQIMDATGDAQWNKIHNGRIQEIAREFQRSLTDGIAEVGRWVDDGLRRAQLDVATITQAEGLSIRESAAMLEDYIRADGLSMPRGYRGQIGDYAEMVARTNLAEANRMARLTRMSERGVTLFLIKSGYQPCNTCAPWEGGIIAMFPNADGIPDYQSIRANRSTHLFGPNCRHERLSPVIPSLYTEEQIQAGIEIAKSAAARFGI